MTRWEPNAGGRLEEAALELFGERGFDQTTVEDIATRAGVTKRTFFRHYSCKREVLFGGGDAFRAFFVESLDGAPVDVPPLEMMAMTLDTVAAAFEDRHEATRRRQTVIAASADLRERELVKLASVSAALAASLRARGVAEPAATITAETAVAVFRNAVERWISTADGPELQEHIRESLHALQAMTAGQ